MDELNAQKLTSKDIWRRIGLHVPFVLLVLFAVVLLGGGAVLFVYSFAAVAATKSAMIFFIFFGGGVLAIGAGLGAVEGFRVYLAFYNEKEKFITRVPKTEIKKNPFSFANICLYVMILGSACVLLSAALGSIKREAWIAQRADYMAENGYYSETQTFSLGYDIDSKTINKVVLDLRDKNAVIVYTSENDGKIKVDGYRKYEDQLCASCGDGVVRVWEGEDPCLDRAKDKMLFFFFRDNEIEAQIRVYIPEYYRDAIEIVGDHVIAQN